MEITGLFGIRTYTVNNNFTRFMFVSKLINSVFSNQRNGWDFALFTSACSFLKHVELL